MSKFYRVIQIDSSQINNPEDMGSKNKFWYKSKQDTTKWLFKYCRKNTGEHWAEKIAAEVAALMKIKHARVELACYEGDKGSATKSITDKYKLLHGNQILSEHISGYDKEKIFKQSDHTLRNIFFSLDNVFVKTNAKQKAKIQIAEYIVLDALIGNTDRHHENWALLRKKINNKWVGKPSPSFDHASSLGRELEDRKRAILLK